MSHQKSRLAQRNPARVRNGLFQVSASATQERPPAGSDSCRPSSSSASCCSLSWRRDDSCSPSPAISARAADIIIANPEEASQLRLVYIRAHTRHSASSRGTGQWEPPTELGSGGDWLAWSEAQSTQARRGKERVNLESEAGGGMGVCVGAGEHCDVMRALVVHTRPPPPFCDYSAGHGQRSEREGENFALVDGVEKAALDRRAVEGRGRTKPSIGTAGGRGGESST